MPQYIGVNQYCKYLLKKITKTLIGTFYVLRCKKPILQCYFFFCAEVPANENRIVEKNKLTILNVSTEDAMVVQCNATNKHGYIFKNAYLYVHSE